MVDLPDWVREKDGLIINNTFREICSKYDVTEADILSSRRPAYVVTPRRLIYYLVYRTTTLTAQQIGRLLGGKDHKTVLHGVNAVRDRCEKDADYKREIMSLERIVTS